MTRYASLDEAFEKGELRGVLQHALNHQCLNGRFSDGTGAHITPLQLCVICNADRAVEFVLRRGADPNLYASDGQTALFMAAVRDQTASAEHLLHHGADPDLTGPEGDTPLHVALVRGFEDLAGLLLRHGADTARPNDRGISPDQIASYRNVRRLIPLFEPGRRGR